MTLKHCVNGGYGWGRLSYGCVLDGQRTLWTTSSLDKTWPAEGPCRC